MRHLEDTLQTACVTWFDYQHHTLRPLLVHCPNGGKRGVCEAARFKAMGVRAGFPDLMLLVPNQEHYALFIELKTDKGRQSPAQKEYQRILQERGARYEVVRSKEQFIETITNYLKTMKRNRHGT